MTVVGLNCARSKTEGMLKRLTLHMNFVSWQIAKHRAYTDLTLEVVEFDEAVAMVEYVSFLMETDYHYSSSALARDVLAFAIGCYLLYFVI